MLVRETEAYKELLKNEENKVRYKHMRKATEKVVTKAVKSDNKTR